MLGHRGGEDLAVFVADLDRAQHGVVPVQKVLDAPECFEDPALSTLHGAFS